LLLTILAELLDAITMLMQAQFLIYLKTGKAKNTMNSGSNTKPALNALTFVTCSIRFTVHHLDT
jgi:hypothetical protein